MKRLNETICSIDDVVLKAGDRSFSATRLMPKNVCDLHTIILCFHGFSSCKNEWIEVDGYTKGGNLITELVNEGYGFIAFDNEWHGEHCIEGMDLEKTLDDDDKFNEYSTQTLSFVKAILDHIDSNELLKEKKMATMSYSMGNVCSTLLMNQTPRFKFAISMVPETFEGDDVEFAPYNNMENLKHIDWLFVLATKDEYVEYSSYKWFMDKIALEQKQSFVYESGHALPLEYVENVSKWIQKRK